MATLGPLIFLKLLSSNIAAHGSRIVPALGDLAVSKQEIMALRALGFRSSEERVEPLPGPQARPGVLDTFLRTPIPDPIMESELFWCTATRKTKHVCLKLPGGASNSMQGHEDEVVLDPSAIMSIVLSAVTVLIVIIDVNTITTMNPTIIVIIMSSSFSS